MNNKRNLFNKLNEEIIKKCTSFKEIEEQIPFNEETLGYYLGPISSGLSGSAMIGAVVTSNYIGTIVGGVIGKQQRNLLNKINKINKNDTNIDCMNTDWNDLLINNSIDSIIENVSFNRFSIQHYLNHLKLHVGITFEQICKESNHKESYIKPVFNVSNKKAQRSPNRDCVIGLSFAFKLNLVETNYLLRAAGFNELYLRDKRDLIIAKCIIDSMVIKQLNYYLKKYKCNSVGNLDKEEGFLEAK